MTWYRKAADQGNASAQFKSVVSMRLASAFAQDNGLARTWRQKAADQWNAAATNDLTR
jgi:TPR repeat protein